MPVKNRFAEMLPEIAAWRQDIHENPELLFSRLGAATAERLAARGAKVTVFDLNAELGEAKAREIGGRFAAGFLAGHDGHHPIACTGHKQMGRPLCECRPSFVDPSGRGRGRTGD